MTISYLLEFDGSGISILRVLIWMKLQSESAVFCFDYFGFSISLETEGLIVVSSHGEVSIPSC
tara:strand:+ start:1441 stop:1629 length:189 start_codon:yes stop_codon:yes gene_type:complete